jgi:hypothetical protein
MASAAARAIFTAGDDCAGVSQRSNVNLLILVRVETAVRATVASVPIDVAVIGIAVRRSRIVIVNVKQVRKERELRSLQLSMFMIVFGHRQEVIVEGIQVSMPTLASWDDHRSRQSAAPITDSTPRA